MGEDYQSVTVPSDIDDRLGAQVEDVMPACPPFAALPFHSFASTQLLISSDCFPPLSLLACRILHVALLYVIRRYTPFAQ